MSQQSQAPHVDRLQTGQGDRPLLALHASGTGAHSLLRLAGKLEKRFSLTLVNLHGYGASRCAGGIEAPLEQHLDVAASALAGFEGRPVHLFGHSMGGVVTLQLALAHPNAIASLLLAEPVAFGALDRQLDADVIELDHRSVQGFSSGDASALATFIEFWNGTPWPSLPGSVQKALSGIEAQIQREALCVSADNTPADRYAEIQCPVSLMVGSRTNPVARRICERLAQHLPHWRVSTIDDAGHMLAIEQPDQIAARILERSG